LHDVKIKLRFPAGKIHYTNSTTGLISSGGPTVHQASATLGVIYLHRLNGFVSFVENNEK